MADVYLAEDQELGRRVALKLLDDRHANDEQFVERFRREAQNAAGLNHPNIVSIFDRGQAEGTYYIAMEFLDGRTLKELIVRNGPDADPDRDRLRAADPARARLRAPQRDRPPRHQAAQHRRRPRRPPQGHRLRHRPLGRVADDGGRLDRRHGAVPLARAGPRRAGRPALRPLLARDRALRDADREGAVHGRRAGRDRDEAPLVGAGAAVDAAARGAARRSTRSSCARSRRTRPSATGSAEEMDADLARVARGLAVSPRTEEAATQVLAGAGDAAAADDRLAAPAAPPRAAGRTARPARTTSTRRRAGRSIWPWLLGAARARGRRRRGLPALRRRSRTS